MPIRRQHRSPYPIDWQQISASIRFGRAKGAVSIAAGRTVARWFISATAAGGMEDGDRGVWRDGRKRALPGLPAYGRGGLVLPLTTKVFLAAVHLDHNRGNNRRRNLKAFCQRCHAARPRRTPPPPPAHLPDAQGVR